MVLTRIGYVDVETKQVLHGPPNHHLDPYYKEF